MPRRSTNAPKRRPRPRAERVRHETEQRRGGHGRGSVARLTGQVHGDHTTRHGREELRHAGARRLVGGGAKRIAGDRPH